MAAEGDDAVLVAWTDYRAGDGDIYVQRLGADGTIAAGWSPSGIAACGAPGQQGNPRIVASPGGGATVVWEDRRSGALDVYAIRIGADGAPAPGWPADGVSLTGGRFPARLPGLLAAPGGAVVATWQSGDSGNWKLVAAVVGDGLAVGQPVLVTTLSSGADRYGEPASLVTGDATVLCWVEHRAEGGELRLQRLTAVAAVEAHWGSGRIVPVEGTPVTDAPALLAPTDSTVAIAWQEHRNDAESDVFVHLIHASDGSTAGLNESGTRACAAAGDQFAPRMVGDGAGVVVFWNDSRPIAADSVIALSAGGSTTVQLVSAHATPGRARVVWWVPREFEGSATVLRRIGTGAWEEIAPAAVDDSAHTIVDDRTVPEGVRAEYRLRLVRGQAVLHTDGVSLEIPAAPRVLTLHSVIPLGRAHAIRVSFALPRGEPPRLDLLDVQGRRMFEQRIEGLEAGEQHYLWRLPGRVQSGIYFMRLVQGREARTAKVVYIR